MLERDELDDLDVVARKLEQAGASGVGDFRDEPLAQRAVPQQRAQHLVVELPEQLVLAARHGEDHAGAAAHGPIECRVRRGVAGVEADDEIDVVEIAPPRCRRPRSERPAASRRRASASQSATTSGLTSSPRRLTCRPWPADEEVVERERQVGASRSEVDDAQASVREPRNDVLDELDESVHLPELPPALRAHAAVRGLDAELHEERDGLSLGQEVALPSVVCALRPWPRRRPPQDARRVAPGQDLPVGVGLLEQRLPVAATDRLAKEGDELRAVEVLVRRPALVVATHVPASLLPDGHRLDGDPPRPAGCAVSRPAERHPRQRRVVDEPLHEIGDVAHSVGRRRRPVARSRRRPRAHGQVADDADRGATISFSIFIASTTQSS